MVEVTEVDMDRAACYLSNRSIGSPKTQILATWKAAEDYVHPLVFLFATHREQARREALEEAAKVAEACDDRYSPGTFSGLRAHIAAAIRKLGGES